MATHILEIEGNLRSQNPRPYDDKDFTAPASVLGAIIGDIVGSTWEFNPEKPKDLNFDLFPEGSTFTDDTVLTVKLYELAQYLAAGKHVQLYNIPEVASDVIRKAYKDYPKLSWGNNFVKWCKNPPKGPYGNIIFNTSAGNGSAMRVGFASLCDSVQTAKTIGALTAMPTHNSPAGIKGAECVAACIKAASNNKDIRSLASQYYPILKYNKFTVENLHRTYQYTELCEDTVPQAIECFLESESFEDAIRKAIYIGGDSDTIAAITGSIAGAYYVDATNLGGIPNEMLNKVKGYLPNSIMKVLTKKW